MYHWQSRHNPRLRVPTTRKHGRAAKSWFQRRLRIEELEPRRVLAGVPIPTAIIPSAAPQTLFAPGEVELTIPSVPATGGVLHRFVVDTPGYSNRATFQLAPVQAPPTRDAALALYDASGNLVASVDADLSPGAPGAEQLSAEVVSGSVYTLGAFFHPSGPQHPFTLIVSLEGQEVNTPLGIDPTSGNVTFVANFGEDSFTSPRDVDYYPLDLTNGGDSGTVTVTPLGQDGEVFATVYRRADASEPWRFAGSASDGSGAPIQLPLLPIPGLGKSLTDAQYLLALATENFDGGTGGYQIDVDAGPVLAPADVGPNPVVVEDFGTLAPRTPGLAGADFSGSLSAGSAELYKFRAPQSATASLSVHSTMTMVVSVYEEDGTLSAVHTTLGSPAELELPVDADGVYFIRMATKSAIAGSYSAELRTSYTPADVDLTGGPATVQLVISPAHTGAAFRVAPTANDDILVVQLEISSAADANVVVVGAGTIGQDPFRLQAEVAAGNPLVWPINISGQAGPFDVFLQGLSTVANVTMTLGAIDIPTTIVKGTVPDEGLATSGNLAFTRATTGFGDMTGAQFVELQRESAGGVSLVADGLTGARLPHSPVPILAHYRQVGSTLRLQSVQVADEFNQAVLNGQNLTAKTLHALIGFNASFAGAGAVNYNVSGPQPAYVGIQMVPDVSEPTPVPDRFIFAARNITLASPLDRDLWKTILPFNILTPTSYPIVTFKPSESTMEVHVTATLDPDDPNAVIGAGILSESSPSMTLVEPVENLRGATLYFVVDPVMGQFGNGIYTLEMTVDTTDPLPHLVEEPAFRFFGTNPSNTPAGTVVLPNEPIVDIVQDPTGFGFATGSFTQSTPHQPPLQVRPGAIDVYRFWAVTPGPISVRTIGLPDSTGEINVNTNFRIYREFVAPNDVTYLDDFLGKVNNGLGDWFPADRSIIDDQTYVNYFEAIAYDQQVPSPPPSAGNNFYLTHGGAYYVVVKNEQGTLGDYRIEVDTQPFPLLGNGTTYDLARRANVITLPWNTSTSTQATFNLPYVTGVNRFVGYVPIQLPEFHNGNLQVVGQANSGWNLNLYDESFAPLSGTVAQVSSPSHTEGSFTVPQGNQRVYLRVHELGENPAGWTSLTVSLGLVQPFGIAAPPNTLPVTAVPRVLPTSPSGDTPVFDGDPQPFFDAFTAGGQMKYYSFQSQAGQLTIQAKPQRDPQGVADVEFAWGIYVNGQLKAWNHSLNALPTGGSELQVFLNNTRPPIDPTDYDYDRGPYFDVVLSVQTVSTPMNGGDFSIDVTTSGTLPMRDGDLILPPVQFFSSVSDVKNGNDWTRFFVPHGASSLSLDVGLQNGIDPGGLRFFADVYGNDGAMVLSETIVSDPITTGAVFSLTSLEQGKGYFLRTGYRDNAAEPVSVELSAVLFKNLPGNSFNEPSAQTLDLSQGPSASRLATSPFGYSGLGFAGAGEYRQVFWAGASGHATFSASVGTLDDHYVALYRLSRDCVAEFCSHTGYLVDFANGASWSNGKYELTTFVEPGAYLLRTVQFGQTASLAGHILIPSFVNETVVLEPNSGANVSESMFGVAVGRDGFGQPTILNEFGGAFGEQIPEGLRTSIFRVVAPPGALGDVTTEILDLHQFPLNFTSAQFFITLPNTAPPDFYLRIPLMSMTIPHRATAEWNDAHPGEVFYTGIFREMLIAQGIGALPSPIGAAFDFVTPESGQPDLVIEPLTLAPDGGKTLVGVTIRNRGFGSAPTTHSQFRYSDTSGPSVTHTEAVILEQALGPRTTRPRSLQWVPNAVMDRVWYTADFDELLEELREDNNAAEDTIFRVNKHAPVITLTLGTPSIDGNSNPTVFGRYVSKVPGVISNVTIGVSDGDGLDHLYKTDGQIPWRNQEFVAPIGQFFSMGSQSQMVLQNFDFGSLFPTASNNPNEFRLLARDIYGVPSQEFVRTVQVMPFPGWLLPNDDKSLKFNPTTKNYEIKFRNQLIDIGPTSLTDLLGTTIPFVGALQNRFLLEMGADATASLNPNQPVNATAYARAEITVLGDTIVNSTYQLGLQTPSNLVSITGSVDVSSLTLDADYLDVTFAIDELPLFSFASPKIPLFAYGVPGVAAIQASLQFSFSASIESKVTLAMDLTTPPHQPANVGFASPTFIAANLDAGLSISGDITFLGLDLASLTGTIHLVISPAYGLESPPGQFVPFNQFANNDCFEITGQMYGEIAAEVFGIEVFSFDLPSVSLPFPGSCDVVGHRPGGLGEIITIPGGNDLVGEIILRAAPQLAINHASQEAAFVQLVDVDPSASGIRQNLAWARRRANGDWSLLTTIADPLSHITNPLFAQTHDGSGASGVVAYNAVLPLGDPAMLTRNQFFTGQELRYRYFDGQSWSAEQSLTADSFYDFDHALDFNSLGKGAVAWVKNGSMSPMNSQGRFDRSSNEIYVALWNPSTKMFGAAQALTMNGVGDSQPAVYAAEDGRMYVVWIQDTAFDPVNHVVTSNQVMFSVFDPFTQTWSAPTQLPINGFPSNGTIGALAIGSHGGGRINVLIAHNEVSGDLSVQSRLFNRSTTQSGFTSAAPWEIVAENANFSDLRVTNAADGALIAYWMSGNGQSTDVWASRLAPTGSGPSNWSTPFALTSTDGNVFTMAPALAVEADGTYQVVYEHRLAPVSPLPNFPVLDGHPDGDPLFAAPFGGGVQSSSYRLLPEFGFQQEFAFRNQTEVVAGQTAEGTAIIVNRGLVADRVVVEYIQETSPGTFVTLASQSVLLSPGATYDARYDYSVAFGPRTLGIRLSSASGTSEMVGSGDNLSLDMVTGKRDLALTSVVLSNPDPVAGETVTVQVTIQNISNVDVGSFRVELYDSNPRWQFHTANLIGSSIVPQLNPLQSTIRSFQWTVPAAGGRFPLFAVADLGQTLGEVSYANNQLTGLVKVLPDVAVQSISTNVLNFSGVNNIEVSTVIANVGKANANGVTVWLYHSLDNGPFEFIDSLFFQAMAPGQVTPLLFLAPGLVGLTGENRYRVLATFADQDPSNQLQQTLLILQGLPDLMPTGAHLDTATPAQGQPANMIVDIQNLGIATAEQLLVEVYGTNPDDTRYLLGTHVVPRVDPLSTMELQIPLDMSQIRGFVEFCVEVDGPQEILELTDLNNFVCFHTMVAAGPPRVTGLLRNDGADTFERLTSLTFQFDTDVSASLDVEDLRIVNQATGASIDLRDLDPIHLVWDGPTRTARWDLSSLLIPHAWYDISLNGQAIFDAAGTLLDGNGDGIPGDDYMQVLLVALPGDANLDGCVDGLDFSSWNAHKFTDGRTWHQGDFDHDGVVDGLDFGLWNQNKFDCLPMGAPSSPAPIFTVQGAARYHGKWGSEARDVPLSSLVANTEFQLPKVPPITVGQALAFDADERPSSTRPKPIALRPASVKDCLFQDEDQERIRFALIDLVFLLDRQGPCGP